MRSRGWPTACHAAIATSSSPSLSPGSPAKTLTQSLSKSRSRWSRMNSHACSTAPSLKYSPMEQLPIISKKERW